MQYIETWRQRVLVVLYSIKKIFSKKNNKFSKQCTLSLSIPIITYFVKLKILNKIH